jgi:hypothetical protein
MPLLERLTGKAVAARAFLTHLKNNEKPREQQLSGVYQTQQQMSARLPKLAVRFGPVFTP